MKTSRIFLPLMAPTLLAFTACSDNGPYADTFVNYDIVQVANADNSNGTDFLLYRPNSDEPVTYHDTRNVLSQLPVDNGDRVLIAYTCEQEPYVTGNINVTGYSTIYNSRLIDSNELADYEPAEWEQKGIYLYSIWRAGPFLNVHAAADYADDGTALILTVNADDYLQQTPTPRLDLSFRMQNPVTNYRKEFYASFDISELWNNSWCTGIEVTLQNTNLNRNIFNFTKN